MPPSPVQGERGMMARKLHKRPPGSDPYLSVVATARNDDHGGNPLYRTQLFVNGLIAQCDRFRLPAELVLVEWNPPSDRPRLEEVLEWPAGERYCTVRIVEVPHELHSTLEHSERLPLFQMIGKNVGIRRARGTFVVATNIDILFSDQLMRFIADRRLRRGFVYRVDRMDVPAEIDPSWPLQKQLDWCRRSVIRVNRREGTLDLRDGTFYRIYDEFSFLAWLRNHPVGRRLSESVFGRVLGLHFIAFANSVPHSGFLGRISDAVAASRLWTGSARRTLRAVVAMLPFFIRRTYAFVYWFVAGFNNPRAVPARIRRRLRMLAAAAEPAPEVVSRHSRTAAARRRPSIATGIVVALGRAFGRVVRRKSAALHETWNWERARIRLHTNASGDFTLMSRDDWLRSKGYAEFEMYSMHIDGLHLYTAHYSGITERFLPFPAYHIEHGGGFRPEATKDDALEAILNRRAIPQISNEQLMEFIVEMYRTNAPLDVNKETWGFADAELAEVTPSDRAVAAVGAVTQ
jgi:hypothetical protein